MKTIHLVPCFLESRCPEVLRNVLVLLLVTVGTACRATSYIPAGPQEPRSENQEYMVRIDPSSGYAGRAKATVSKKVGATGEYSVVSQFFILNRVSPVMACITNDGRYLVTFDDWGADLPTENAVVVYALAGGDIYQFPPEVFPRAVYTGSRSLKFYADLLHAREQGGKIWVSLRGRGAGPNDALVVDPSTRTLSVQTR